MIDTIGQIFSTSRHIRKSRLLLLDIGPLICDKQAHKVLFYAHAKSNTRRPTFSLPTEEQ